MDRLEEYIRKNRQDLDRYTPSSSNWKKIERRLKREISPFKKLISIAAMVVVLLGTALILLKPLHRLSADNGNDLQNSFQASDNPQLKETEIYYNNLINSLYQEAKPLLTGNPEINKELNTDISHLDSICLDIKRDLKDNVANQEVVEALIQNYRIKIRLLEDMLIMLKENKDNPEKSISHEL